MNRKNNRNNNSRITKFSKKIKIKKKKITRA